MRELLSSPEVAAAMIGAATTMLTGVAGFGVLVWRLRKEAGRAIAEMHSAEATKLKLRIYIEEVVRVVDNIVDAEVALSGFIRRFEIDLNTSRALVQQGLAATLPVARVPELIQLKADFDLASVKIVTFVETWLVVDPRLAVFQTAINAATHDLYALWGKYFDSAMRALPADLPQGVVRWNLPDAAFASSIIAAGNELIDGLQVIGCYAADFRSEMQSILVGTLFKNTVPRRQPIDPRFVVVTLDNADALLRHFDQTPWGRNRQQLFDDLRSRVGTTTPARCSPSSSMNT